MFSIRTHVLPAQALVPESRFDSNEQVYQRNRVHLRSAPEPII